MHIQHDRPTPGTGDIQDDTYATVARLALEWVFEDSYAAIAAAAARDGVTVQDLHALGAQIAEDTVRLARGEITCIVVPSRWPRAGEHQRKPQRFWEGYQPFSPTRPS